MTAETEAYNDHVEACRAWGKAEKEKLLGPPIKVAVESWLSSKEALSVVIKDATTVGAAGFIMDTMGDINE